MKLNIEYLFDKIEKAEVQSHPFNHMVIDNFLPNDFYVQLSQELESQNFSQNYIRGAYGNKERYAVDLTHYDAWKSSGKKISTATHPHNYQMLSAISDSNIKLFVDTLLQNEKKLYSLMAARMPTERFQDEYFFHINMTKDGVGYTIEPHTDDSHNIYTILFYTPETDINKQFGLQVCEEKIDFLPNRMIIFPPSKPNNLRPATWHAVKRLTSDLVGTRNSFQMFFVRNIC